MDAERAKALSRCVTLIRIAEDTRCPDGERAAAKERAKVIAKRHHLTRAEVKDERTAQDLAAEPRLVRVRREREEQVKQEAVRRDRERAAAAQAQGTWSRADVRSNLMRFAVEGDGKITIEII